MVPVVSIMLITTSGCASRTSDDKDGSVPRPDSTTVPLPDGYGPLWPCETPGQSCNAHDPCAIDPVCGADKQCHPAMLQDCSDELECTTDICKGMGLCEHVPKEGTCALPMVVGGKTVVRCFKEGEKNPDDECQLCKPEESAKSWTGANGGACEDGNKCTKDDYCQNGVCKGVYYGNQCADEYGCTEDLCDGKGGCLGNKLKSDWCLINGVCYQDQSKHPAGTCFVCDVSKSQSSWTAITNTCFIDNKCYQKGDKNSGGCAECDPVASTTSWTVKGDNCLINDTCQDPGDKDSTNCAECDPGKDKYNWTPLAGLCKIAGTCYQGGDKHPGGCAECDPIADPTAWTVKGSYCLIDNVCKNPGDKDAIACSSCDPTKDPYGWTALPGLCKIYGQCYSKGDKHPQGCGECDPDLDPTFWTVPGTNCLIVDTCYSPGAADPTGCGTCDPTQSKTEWTVSSNKCLIGDKCYNPGDKDLIGCGSCDPTQSKTSWTQIPGCFKIIFTALNEAHDGKLGGVSGADALCAQQAAKAGYTGTFKAFLSTSTQNAKDLIGGTDATNVAVVNTGGEQLYQNWNEIFTKTGWTYGIYIYTFDGTKVDENTVTPNWTDADAWSGTLATGTVSTGETCQDWTSNTSTDFGSVGELDMAYWPNDSTNTSSCDTVQAVVCVQTAP
jgi:hypothetical protein